MSTSKTKTTELASDTQEANETAQIESSPEAAAAILKEVTEQGYMVYIGPAGQPRTTPVLPADLHQRFTANYDGVKKIIVGGE